MKHVFLVVLMLICAWFIHPLSAFASDEFSVSLINTHTVNVTGGAHIRKDFTVVNKKSSIFLSKYGIEITSTRLRNIVVTSAAGTLPANVVINNSATTIGIELPDKVVGKDQTQTFTVEYDDPDAAVVTGNVVEVYVPKIADTAQFDAYSAILKLPQQFGQPQIVFPEKFEQSTEGQYTVYVFSNADALEGISAIFGEKQFLSFSLQYNLKNPVNNASVTQVAFPPDTQYQRVVYDSIEPRPDGMEKDLDGNWIGTYTLDSNQELKVEAKGKASIQLNPDAGIPLSPPTKDHTKTDTYWEASDPLIQSIAQKNRTPKSIFDFVVNSLEYDTRRISTTKNRFGAKKVLENNEQAVCQDFADLFIAVSRANNIPARLAIGYAITTNPETRPSANLLDVLHAWPEYFDEQKNIWKPVDPTWANTTGGVDYFTHLDFNHFVFVYQGVSSLQPYPAGAYQQENDQHQDVNVEVTDQEPVVEEKLDFDLKQPLTNFIGVFQPYQLRITNSAGSALYRVSIQVTPSSGITTTFNQPTLEAVLPYQTVSVPVSLLSTNWFLPKSGSVTIQVNDIKKSFPVSASPKLHFSDERVLIGVVVGSGIVFTLIIFLMMIKFGAKKKRKKVTYNPTVLKKTKETHDSF